jgi:hypothetical protein
MLECGIDELEANVTQELVCAAGHEVSIVRVRQSRLSSILRATQRDHGNLLAMRPKEVGGGPPMNCDLCRGPVFITAEEHFHLIIDGRGEEAEQYDFCSWRCLKNWVSDS